MIDRFLDDNMIDVTTLERIKHRLFIVGRFNQRNTGPYPDLYLFKNPNRSISGRYKENFKEVWPLRYESFVQALGPAIAERVIPGKIPMVLQVVPQGDDAVDGSSVIDIFNFFFQRADANSDQEAFQGSQPGLPRELLKDSERDRGKTIFKLIRNNLNLFSRFQPRTYELVEAISKLLGNCGMENNMPPYASGGALPAGFPERLIDYLYAEDSRKPFSAEGLEFGSEPWAELQRNERAREMFCNVVTAFRDELLAAGVEQFNDFRFKGKTLNEQARRVLKEDLMKDFRRARDAFNGLRQILRSKVLLSMVLEWLLQAYYEIDDVKALGGEANDDAKDRAVEKAILYKSVENDLAKPVKRASPEERRKFKLALTENFEFLLKAILAKDDAAAALINKLPQALQSLAQEVRRDRDRKRVLAGISGSDLGSDYEKAFIEASKVVLLDVLCPTLFQIPMLSEHMLRQFFRQETMAAYLTAVFLANDSQDAVRKIAEDHIELFQSKIDNATQSIRDTGELQQRLLGSFLDVLAKPEIQRRLKEGLHVLSEAHTILEHATFGARPGQEPGAGKISAIFPDPAYRESSALEQTGIRDEDVTKPLQKVVEEQVERIVEKAAAAASGGARAQAGAAPHAGAASEAASFPPGGGAADRGLNGGADKKATAGAAGAPEESPSRRSDIEQNAEEKVNSVLARLFPDGTPTNLKQSQVTKVVSDATEQLTQDGEFLAGVKGDVRAFEQALYLIYQRYNENAEKKTFRNRVERLTLINMMLLFQKDLGLGQVCSNLYHLLLDLIQHLDPENPDPKAFLAEKSLTVYFDNAVLADGGITRLRETLDAQAHLNLQSTVDFVSELKGVKYLIDAVANDREAEIIVINATAGEFLNWLRTDNLLDDRAGKMRLVSGNLVTNAQNSQKSIQPGLVYLTDIAFTGTSKGVFIDNLSQFQMREGDLSLLLPPLCISTPMRQQDWIKQGRDWAMKAKEAPAPVVIVGPASFMNRPDDAFKTYLPAGYLFAAHFLCRPDQKIQNEFVPVQSSGRFRVIGFGAADMRESLDRVLWGESQADSYAFAVDFYLYIVLTVMATAVRRGGALYKAVEEGQFYEWLHYVEGATLNPKPWQSTRALNKTLLGGDALRFAMELSEDFTELLSVSLKPTEKKGLRLAVRDIGWFNRARKNAGIP